MKKHILFLPFLVILSAVVIDILIYSPKEDTYDEQYFEKSEVKSIETSSDDLEENIKLLIRSAISSALDHYQQGDYQATWVLFKDTHRVCQVIECDERIYLWPYINLLVESLENIDHFSKTIENLKLFRDKTWTKKDIDGDGNPEIIALTKDWMGQMSIRLLTIKEINSKLYHSYYEIDGAEYVYDESEVFDLTGDRLPEILVFAGPGRGGGYLYIFNFTNGSISQIFRKSDIFYPNYNFLDSDGDGILEIVVEGYSSGPTNTFIKCPPCKVEKVRQIIKFIGDEGNFRIIQEEKLPV